MFRNLRPWLVSFGVMMAVFVQLPVFAGLLDFVPQNSPIVINLNLAKLLNFEAVKSYMDGLNKEQTDAQKKAMADFTQKTGLEPGKTIQNVLVFFQEKLDPAALKDEAGVLLGGTFDVKKIVGAIESDPELAKTAETGTVEGLSSIGAKGNAAGKGVFLDGSTLLVANPSIIKTVAQLKDKKTQGIMANPAFASLMAKVDMEAGIWGGFVVTPALKASAKADKDVTALSGVNAVFFSINAEKDFSFNLTGEAENAPAVKEFLTNFVEGMKAWAGGAPEILDLIKATKVEGNDKSAKLTFQVPSGTFTKAWEQFTQRISTPAKK